MSKKYPVAESTKSKANLSEDVFNSLYKNSIADPDSFWRSQASQNLTWIKEPTQISSCDMRKGKIEWFKDGILNASYNCIDKHLDKPNKTAIIWESDDPSIENKISFQELHDEVCKFSNLLKSRKVKKGDRVCIYMPMIPEAAYAMLACARIGAIHSVVFGGFSVESLKDRILDSSCETIITANEGVRGGKKIPLKENVDEAIKSCPNVHSVIVVHRADEVLNLKNSIDVDYFIEKEKFDAICDCEPMSAEDPLFILYTSGSTGKPKGVLHSTGGYLLGATLTHKYIFNYADNDIYWCTADVGWVTGHSYIIYGPLSNGATTLMFEGVPTYPNASRFWEIIDKHKVNIFYTAPTAIRALMAFGDDPLNTSTRESLKVLGTVGEPINPEAWEWYYEKVGKKKCPIVDTWWQTETGSIMISGLAGFSDQKPGSACKPFFGVVPVLLDENGNEIEGSGSGNLAIRDSWPSQIRTVYGDHQLSLIHI